MLIKITAFAELNARALMDLYAEGNIENAEYFYPDIEDRAQAVERVEREFLEFIERDFLSSDGNAYYILADGGEWVSALRLSLAEPATYYIEALETKPAFRRRGCASRLLEEVIAELKKQGGSFRICDCVGKGNEPSIRTHEKCGFRIVSEVGYNYLSGETNEQTYSMEYDYASDPIE